MNSNSAVNNSNTTSDDKEQLQKRHYFLLEQLNRMIATQVPIDHRKFFTSELLTAVSQSLLDGTVFEIVSNLCEMQHFSERTLFTERAKLSNEYSNHRNQLIQRHKATERACETRPHNLNIVRTANKRELDAFEKRMSDELHRFDLKIVDEMDKRVVEQQSIMREAGVHGFAETKNPNELIMQMHLLRLIQRLSHIQPRFN